MSSVISSMALPAHTPIPSGFSVYDKAFYNILGSAPTLEVIAQNSSFPFAHEASVYIPEKDELFLSSNIFTDPVTNESTIKISKVNVGANPVTSEIIDTNVSMANGGTNYKGGVLWTAQGTLNETGGVVLMSSSPPYGTHLFVGDYLGRPFNSLNDIVVAKDGAFWFTDPIYGWRQGIRPKPQLRQQVYRYAFDVSIIHGQPFLTNRRLFAVPGNGIPDGIKVDQYGNVYAGCKDGVNVWSAGGVLLGKVLVKGGTSNFSFGKNGSMFILNENRLYRAQLNPQYHGTLV
ncbi:SMP-30/Gluconolaconase/LRE-like region [Penicillium chermesinum]|nr:SMP-30/Gluconolaconase/LRE-like region [Penicillium chermesinum]